MSWVKSSRYFQSQLHIVYLEGILILLTAYLLLVLNYEYLLVRASRSSQYIHVDILNVDEVEKICTRAKLMIK